jgi:lipopolysaccharide assembly protein A
MLRALLLLPFLLLLIAFAISNPQPVTLALWPTDVTLEAPLSIAVLVIAGVFFLLGGLIVWVPAVGHRMRARRAERKVSTLEAEKKAAMPTPGAPKVPALAGPR